MRVVVRTAAWVLVFVALGAVFAAWFTPRPELDAVDAADTAVGAFTEVGLEGSPGEPIERAQHSPAAGDPVERSGQAWAASMRASA